jgi:hypothetical protein
MFLVSMLFVTATDVMMYKVFVYWFVMPKLDVWLFLSIVRIWLNLKHLHGIDRAWESVYPSSSIVNNNNTNIVVSMSFDDIKVYRHNEMHSTATIAIVTYGNGVGSSLLAKRKMQDGNIIRCESDLSRVPNGLMQLLATQQYNLGGILFADICKQGPATNALSSLIMELQQAGFLPPIWDFIGAPRTYNPLGSTLTFQLHFYGAEKANAFTKMPFEQAWSPIPSSCTKCHKTRKSCTNPMYATLLQGVLQPTVYLWASQML